MSKELQGYTDVRVAGSKILVKLPGKGDEWSDSLRPALWAPVITEITARNKAAGKPAITWWMILNKVDGGK
jgi:hypothetical protein